MRSIYMFCFFLGLFGCVGIWVLLCAVCTDILGLLRVVHGGYFSLLWGGDCCTFVFHSCFVMHTFVNKCVTTTTWYKGGR